MKDNQHSDFININEHVDFIEMLDRYGSTSLAYKVRMDGRLCFMKKLRPELQFDKKYRNLFLKEFSIGKQIHSPYIVEYVDLKEDATGMYILMEYVSGSTLAEKIEHDPEFFFRKDATTKMLQQLCWALKVLHSQNIAHLDVTPNNIIISQTSGDVKLLDLGFCLSNYDDTTPGSTSKYGAPETLAGNIKEIDARADIYSIGRILQYIEEKCGRKINSHLRRIMKRCLQPQKEKRYYDINELLEDINAGNKKRHFLIAMAAALLFLLLFLINVFDKDAIADYIAWERGEIGDKFMESGIYYQIKDHDARTVEVTYKGNFPSEYDSEYGDGTIRLPAEVTHRGRTFRVTSIGSEVFDNCETRSILIPEGMEVINDEAFSVCRLTGSVHIPASVMYIGAMTYHGNTYIDSISVAAANPIYDSRNGCNAIIETASNTLIVACSNTTIPSDVEAIGNNAFWLYQQPTVVIPNKVRSIGQDAFCQSALTEIYLPSSVTRIDKNAFLSCQKLQKIVFSENLVEIGPWAFLQCGFQEVVIPHSVTTISEAAFKSNPNLHTVVLGRNISKFEAYAFADCNRLTKVISHIPADSLNPTGIDCFKNISKNSVLYVPKGAKAKYTTTYGWNQFRRIVEM